MPPLLWRNAEKNINVSKTKEQGCNNESTEQLQMCVRMSARLSVCLYHSVCVGVGWRDVWVGGCMHRAREAGLLHNWTCIHVMPEVRTLACDLQHASGSELKHQ